MAGFLTATVVAQISTPAAFGGGGALAATVTPGMNVAATFSGAGALAASVAQKYTLAPALSGGGALAAGVTQKYTVAAALSGGGALAATVVKVAPTITSITTAPFHVGDEVLVTGTGLATVTSITVGGVAVIEGYNISDTELAFTIPVGVAVGSRNVVATSPSGSSAPYAITVEVSVVDFTDTFTRADSATPGAPWIGDGSSGDFAISGNMLVSTDQGGGDFLFYTGPLTSDGLRLSVTMGCNSDDLSGGMYLNMGIRTNTDMSLVSGVGMVMVTDGDGDGNVSLGYSWLSVTDEASAPGDADYPGSFSGWVIGDVFVLESVGDKVAYLKNGTPLAVLSNPPGSVPAGADYRGLYINTYYAVPGTLKIDQIRVQEIDTMTDHAQLPPVIEFIQAPSGFFRVGNSIDIYVSHMNEPISVTVGGVAATSVTTSGTNLVQCVIPSVALGSQNVVVTGRGGASSAWPITVVSSFTPTSETNVTRTNVAIPSGATEWRFRGIGPGGNGGVGHSSAATARGGGGGGGGGAYVDSGWQSVTGLGATYSVARGTAAGTNTVFSSGSKSVTAGTGGTGGNGTSTVVGTAGAAGVASQAGLTGVTLSNGGAGTAGGATSGGSSSAAGNIATNAAAGGSGGGGLSAAGSAGQSGKGGNSATATGGAARTTAGVGNTGGTGTGGTAGAGGSGGMASAGASRAGGNGGAVGGGGGGSSPGNSGTSAGGTGQAGMTIMEWR